MQIQVLTTDQFSNSQLETFSNNFNKVFNKDFNVDHFKRKYRSNFLKKSFHSLYTNETAEIFGSINVIPFKYNLFDKKIVIGLVVDVFIAEDKREDPLALYKMYTKLKPFLKANSIDAIVAVPNELIYKYWKQVVRWKDIGILKTWIIPKELGNVLSQNRFRSLLNLISTIIYKLLLLLNVLTSYIYNAKAKQSEIRLIKDENFEKFRYQLNHIIENNDSSFRYSINKEESYTVAYLIDFFDKDGNRDFRSLLRATKKMMKEKIDAVVYVGSLKMLQTIFIKIPENKLPRKMYLMGDIIDQNKIDQRFFDFSNWDFGLMNFDVR